MALKFNPFTGTFDYINDLYRGALSAAPSNPATGTMYFDTSNSTLYVYFGSWIAIGASGIPAGALLDESGGAVLDETGGYLIED